MKQIKYTNELDNFMKQGIYLLLGQQELKLKALDDWLWKNKPNNIKVKDHRKRRTWTPYGDINISRRRYVDEKGN